MAMIAFALMGALSSAVAEEEAERAAIVFDIPAQSMATALQVFAKQADVQILFKPDSVGEMRTSGLTGRMTVQQALDALLKGTNLEHVRNGDVVVVRSHNGSPGTPAANEHSQAGTDGDAIAQTSESGGSDATSQGFAQPTDGAQGASGKENVARLGETLVTGTLIRGAQTASPLIVVGRTEIEATGYSTVQEVIQSLPQNYGGGDAELAASLPGGSFLNMGMGSAANLRGLGSDSTLVLVNGRRLAPAAFGQFVDISLVPLSVVERVEILPDGASATYGSDAVGGVINLILREEYSGAETLLKGGSTTSSDMEEYQFSQTLGMDGERSQAVMTYEYYKRSDLDANDRDYSAGAVDPHHLLPMQERHSVFAAAGAQAGSRGHLAGTVLFSERDAERVAFDTFAGEPNLEPSETRQLSVSAAGTLDFAASWQAELAALYGRNDSHRDVLTPTTSRSAERNKLQLESLELRADGALFAAAEGEVRLALGGGWREERYEEEVADGFRSDRTVLSAFAELYWPILQQLELSLAARYEEYSDFGSTTNPKLGLVWSPAKRVSLRGTYGTSFRAPILSELDDSNINSLLFDFPDPAAADGTTLSMLVSGNNRDLQPEEATTWTAGFDFESVSPTGVQVHATYFDTEFNDRITEPLPGFEALAVYSQADVYAPIITRPPDPAEVARLAALPAFFNLYGPFVPTDVQAIVDRRRQNISSTHVRGLDFSMAYLISAAHGDWSLRIDSTYYFEYADQITSTAPEDEVLDTAYHPLDLKARAGVNWQQGEWGVSGFVNYSDGYVNETVSPPADIDSWTTVDLQLTYKTVPTTGSEWHWFSDLRIALSVQNVFDEDPPFVTSPLALYEIGFDPTNSSPIGRFLSLTATKRW